MYEPRHTASTSALALNRRRLVEVAGADDAFIAEILEMAVHSLGSLVPRFASELARSDHRAARATAHEIKGLCLNIGAEELSSIAAELQATLDAGRPMPSEADSLPAAYHRFVAQVRAPQTQG